MNTKKFVSDGKGAYGPIRRTITLYEASDGLWRIKEITYERI